MKMNEWKHGFLSDLCVFQRGHDLPISKMKAGVYAVAGSNGIIGYHNVYSTKGPSLTIGRSGNIGTPHYYKEDFWAHNTVLYVTNFKGNLPKYAYYFLKTLDFNQFNAGSAVPTLNRNHIHELSVTIPPLPEQEAIAEVLSSLDDKIDLLHRNNKTLEQLAETLFRQWFVEEADDSWENGIISDLFILQRGFDLPVQDRKDGNVPIVSSSGITDFHSESKVHGIGVVTGRSGVLGGVYLVKGSYWPLNTTLYVKEFKIGQPYFTYFFIRLLDLNSLNAGSAVPTLNRNHVHNMSTYIPPKEKVEEFEKIAATLFDRISNNDIQIKQLEKLRDTLLPKLMSGEVRVQDIKTTIPA